MLNMDDFKQHKQQMESLRIFAKEFGKVPGDKKPQGVGIPSFSVAVKGNVDMSFLTKQNPIGNRVPSKEEKTSFELNKELNKKKIREEAQEFMMGLIREEDFSVYIEKIFRIVNTEILRHKGHTEGSSLTGWEEQISKKALIAKELLIYQEAVKELKDYLKDNEEKHITRAIELLSDSEEKKNPEKEKKVSISETVSPDPPKVTTKIIFVEKVPIAEDIKKTVPLPVTKCENEIKSIVQKQTFTGIGTPLTQTQRYMPSAPAPSWHKHYKGEEKGVKGYDLAYVSQLFKHLTFKQLDQIADKITVEKFNRGDIIFKEEDMDKFYIIRTGKVVLMKKAKDNLMEILTLSSGDILGEFHLIDNEPGFISAKIYSEGTGLLSISCKDFREFLQEYPSLLQNLNVLVSLRLRDFYNKLTG